MKKLILCVNDRCFYLLLLVFLTLANLCWAEDSPKMLKSYDQLKSLPVLDDGRIKPLDTFARNLLLRFSGKDMYEHKSAIEWLGKLLFAPDMVKDAKVFLINNPDIATALSVTVAPDRRYSFSQLQKAAAKLSELAQAAGAIEQKERSIVEQEILRVYENVLVFAGLTQVMSFQSVHDGEMMSMVHLAIIPASVSHQGWLTPWEAVHKGDEQSRIMLGFLDKMKEFYWSGDQVQFDIASHQYRAVVYERLGVLEKDRLKTFPLELLYHVSMPFFWARIFYILAFVCFIASLLSTARFWYHAAWLMVFLGFMPHLGALIARIVIMARPPVTNLYETFIFVSCICVALGVWIEKINKQWMGILVASISGSAFLFIASRYSAEGDTLKMLVAVLNSNFWLSTHVTTITMGYAATCVAGILGHIWLIQACFKKDKKTLDNTYQVMMIILGISLTLTFLGTNLGGIWADQSWGRFWGWDPKENGALMIVLWSAMLFHFRIAKVINCLGMAVGTSLGVVVVMWAWFGVNLLSIGLHSYGFTSGIANTLLIYVVIEIFFLVITTLLLKRNNISSLKS